MIRAAGILALLLLTKFGCQQSPADTTQPPESTVVAEKVEAASGDLGGASPIPGSIVPLINASQSASGTLVGPEPILRPAPDLRRFAEWHLSAPAALFVARIDETGNVTAVRVLRPSHPDVDQVLIESIKGWKFKPAMLGGRPVAVDYTLTVRIDLR